MIYDLISKYAPISFVRSRCVKLAKKIAPKAQSTLLMYNPLNIDKAYNTNLADWGSDIPTQRIAAMALLAQIASEDTARGCFRYCVIEARKLK